MEQESTRPADTEYPAEADYGRRAGFVDRGVRAIDAAKKDVHAKTAQETFPPRIVGIGPDGHAIVEYGDRRVMLPVGVAPQDIYRASNLPNGQARFGIVEPPASVIAYEVRRRLTEADWQLYRDPFGGEMFLPPVADAKGPGVATEIAGASGPAPSAVREMLLRLSATLLWLDGWVTATSDGPSDEARTRSRQAKQGLDALAKQLGIEA